MSKKYLMALDQGTTSSRCILFDRDMNIIASAQKEITQIFPKPGWVEHDPMDIWSSQLSVAAEAMARAGVSPADIIGAGITNQRETAIVWDKNTGKPIYNAIVWQCRRTADICDQLAASGMRELIRNKTGLVLDAYFSGTKIKWLLDNIPGAKDAAHRGNLLFGTVDTWLIWNLTKGRVHATDYSNASRTMLFNIRERKWDEDLLRLFGIPLSMLPEALPSSHIYGKISPELLGGEIPLGGVAGDQQAALFGQCCFEPGMVKNTYGTGCFILMNTGETPVSSSNGLLTTIAWDIGGRTEYCLEGGVFIAGAALQWLRDGLRVIKEAGDSQTAALSVADNGGVYFVPAFVGLGAPYWDPRARGVIAGLTRGSTREHIIRAALESLAYQSYDVIKAMENDSGLTLGEIRVDGGACANDFLMSFQADILQNPVRRPELIESTARGAACLAGLSTGVYAGRGDISGTYRSDRIFSPQMPSSQRDKSLQSWHEAVKLTFGWAKN